MTGETRSPSISPLNDAAPFDGGDVEHPEDALLWKHYAEQLEQSVRDSGAEVLRLKAELNRMKTELNRIKNLAPLRFYRSMRRALPGKTAPTQLRTHERGADHTMASIDKLIKDSPHFHAWPDGKPANWSVAPDVLRFIAACVKPGMQTLETGAGQTTVAFAMAGARHIAITPDLEQTRRIQDYCRENGVVEPITFIHGSSDVVLPSGRDIPDRLDFVLIDGAHRFPFPIIDWHYTAARVPKGGIVAVDDCLMPSVRILHDFLAGEDDWELVQSFQVTAFFRRTRETVSVWDWADQRINKPHVEKLACQPRRPDDPFFRFLRKLI